MVIAMTFEAIEAARWLFSRLLCCLSENNYFDQLNFTPDSHDYYAVTHNCNRLSSSIKHR